MSIDSYYSMIEPPPLTWKKPKSSKSTFQYHRHSSKMCIVIIFLAIIFLLFLATLLSSHPIPNTEPTPTSTKMQAPVQKIIEKNLDQGVARYIYIDVGCFNGESIDHFLHFIPNSSFYEIITFEPDPDNYLLCKQRLSGQKYANVKITIIPKIVWIRDEKVYFHSERGRLSRIGANTSVDDGESRYLDAIDFSAWLANLHLSSHSHVHIKLSLPGAEVTVLEKMVLDDTIDIADKYEIEWTDRENPFFRARRIYIQLMLDNYGYDCLYYTRLQDARKTYQMNGTYVNVAKFYDWTKISESDTFAHYHLRPDMPSLPLLLAKKKRQQIAV